MPMSTFSWREFYTNVMVTKKTENAAKTITRTKKGGAVVIATLSCVDHAWDMENTEMLLKDFNTLDT